VLSEIIANIRIRLPFARVLFFSILVQNYSLLKVDAVVSSDSVYLRTRLHGVTDLRSRRYNYYVSRVSRSKMKQGLGF
jgi:hypothetical protein